ncbi:hypothetical protein BCR34DRAFT_590234 [Clohesyomyces aquaticus]|uniref:Cupredoxin n=1 Tax=Clohesyomyces aquaticus TaxID=1231657 RepID=A0A1Y1ZBQ2_9PLEO|nr:hypothetical protein BCR34DRAFT_590234 [Clohesyomyces aquaticus]
MGFLRRLTTVVVLFTLLVDLVVAQAFASGSAAPTATSSAAQQTHTISVGNGDHKMRPDVTQAEIGDIIEFRFFPVNHSIVRAEYQFPCIPYEMTGKGKVGFFSGFHPVDAILSDPPKWSIKINDTDPIFFYCSAKGSCIDYQMVGVINPNATVSLEVQRQFAKNSSYMLQPGESFPAEGSPLPFTSSSSSASSTSTPTSSSTSSTAAASTAAAAATSSSKSTLGAGPIAGIAVAVVAIIVLAAALFFFIGRSKSLKEVVDRQSVALPAQSPRLMYQHHSYLSPKGGDTMTNPSSRNSAVAMPVSMAYEHPVEYQYMAVDETMHSRSATTSPGMDGRFARTTSPGVPARHPSVLINPDGPQEKDAGYKN